MWLLHEMWQMVPPVTRLVLLVNVSLSLMVSLDLCTPYKLYFNYSLIKNKGQYWRIFTSLFYYGELSPHTIFNFMMFYWNASKLEQIDFRNKPADFLVFFFFCNVCYLLCAAHLGLQFLSPCLSSTMLYLWTRRNPSVHVNIMDVFTFRA